jgi:TolA-binding protein
LNPTTAREESAVTDDVNELRMAAERAHEAGDVGAATVLYRRILQSYPLSTAAADAMYYLTSGHRRPQRHADCDGPSDAAAADRGTL